MKTPETVKRFVNWVEGETVYDTSGNRSEKGADISAGFQSRATGVRVKTERIFRDTVKKRGNIPEPEKEKRDYRTQKRHMLEYRNISALMCISLTAVLLLTVSCLPAFGSPDAPANNEVVERYVEDGLKETGAVNTVAGMILDYRAFDTLGESNVLFIAVCSVIILLRADRVEKNGKANIPELETIFNDKKQDRILKATAMAVVPVGVLFGIYVILNGHLSAGGGFSGGTIIGASLILYACSCGSERIDKFFTFNTYKWVTFAALITYTLLKSYSFFTGANGIESGISSGTPGAILSGGLILPLNICVGLVVACTMYTFYSLFRKGEL